MTNYLKKKKNKNRFSQILDFLCGDGLQHIFLTSHFCYTTARSRVTNGSGVWMTLTPCMSQDGSLQMAYRFFHSTSASVWCLLLWASSPLLLFEEEGKTYLIPSSQISFRHEHILNMDAFHRLPMDFHASVLFHPTDPVESNYSLWLMLPWVPQLCRSYAS